MPDIIIGPDSEEDVNFPVTTLVQNKSNREGLFIDGHLLLLNQRGLATGTVHIVNPAYLHATLGTLAYPSSEVVPATSIRIADTYIGVIGSTNPALAYVVEPANATGTVSWYVTNPRAETRIELDSETGQFTVKDATEDTVIGVRMDGVGDTCVVTPEPLTVTIDPLIVEIGSYDKVTYSIGPSVVHDLCKVVFSSDNTDVLAIGSDGQVYGVTEGTSLVTVGVYYRGAYTFGTREVRVMYAPAEVVLPAQITGVLNSVQNSHPPVTSTNVIWGSTGSGISIDSSSGSYDVIALDDNTYITAQLVGSKRITSCKVNISELQISVPNLTVEEGNILPLVPVVSPSDIPYTLVYENKSPDLCTVSPEGLVAGDAGGVALVDVIASYNGASASTTATVYVSYIVE